MTFARSLSLYFILASSIGYLFFCSLQQDLAISILDVGQGDAIIIRYQNSNYLVDGGGNNTVDEVNIRNIFSRCFYNLIFLSHPHADHYLGLTRILHHCATPLIMFNDVVYDSPSYKEFLDLASPYPHITATSGLIFRQEDLDIITLWPPKDITQPENLNNISTVLLIDYGEFEMLLSGDAEKEVWKSIDYELIDKYVDGRLEVFKVPHHGARNGLYEPLIERLRPLLCVISVGKDNTFGHPHNETLNYLAKVGCSIFRTDIDGNVVVTVKSR